MTIFESLFRKEKKYKIKYNDDVYYARDFIRLSPGERFEIIFESFDNSEEYCQGVAFDSDVELLVAGKPYKGFTLWTDTSPTHVTVQNFSKKNQAVVGLNNVYRSDKGILSLMNGAAMKIDNLPDGTRKYSCNDGEPDDDFEDIVFTLRSLDNSQMVSLLDKSPEEYNKF